MNPRVTVGLLAILLALAAYVYFGAPPATSGGATAGGPGAQPKTPDAQLELWQVQESDIQAVVVRRAGQEAGVERAGEEWRLLPSGDPADRLRVNSLMFRLASLRATRRLAEVSNPAEFGLASPTMMVTLRLADGSTRSLEIGGKAPAEAGTYVRKPDDPAVYVIANATVTDLERLVTEPPVPPSPTPAGSPEASPTP